MAATLRGTMVEDENSCGVTNTDVRIRFKNGFVPSRVSKDLTGQETNNTDIQARHRSFSISQNMDLKDALTAPGREPGINLNTL